LRFKAEEGESFLGESDAGRVPPFVELPKLLPAAEQIIDEDERDEDLRLSLAPVGNGLKESASSTIVRQSRKDIS
jgi:hypothetical protein